MVRDLEIPVQIVVVPTEREADGLARSSRNVYLTPEARKRAPLLYRALSATAAAYRHGSSREEALRAGSALFTASEDEELNYLEIVDAGSFETVTGNEPHRDDALVIAALRLGHVRLLDNVRVGEA